MDDDDFNPETIKLNFAAIAKYTTNKVEIDNRYQATTAVKRKRGGTSTGGLLSDIFEEKPKEDKAQPASKKQKTDNNEPARKKSTNKPANEQPQDSLFSMPSFKKKSTTSSPPPRHSPNQHNLSIYFLYNIYPYSYFSRIYIMTNLRKSSSGVQNTTQQQQQQNNNMPRNKKGTKETGVRWAFNVSQWQPGPEEWREASSLLESEERERIEKFKRPRSDRPNSPLIGRDNPDAKASLIGRLMIRSVVNYCLGIPFNQIQLSRTSEKKPYLVNLPDGSNFNFNVSHAGDWVVLGAENDDIIGVDVMDVKIPGRQSAQEFFHTMREMFTGAEWRVIKEPSSEKDQVAQFFRIWCLKEAYIKAVGVGLGFDLKRAQFHMDNKDKANSATLTIDGGARPDWRFDFAYLDDIHIVACGMGPPFDASAASKEQILQAPNSPGSERDLPAPPFYIVSIEELLKK
eukprot:TRINITY_DN4994_c2_g1_i2.p1 TRINITY_DN4994_c2_g1~~TRINITY_DN4994_c2_g1_i2.p1  ORF type:complete len:457 (-),score=110.69 TRINITY_DN4994_c2_g1_i2:64-1434(-)